MGELRAGPRLASHDRLDGLDDFDGVDEFDRLDEFDGLDEFDAPAEVAASARTQRRIALGYGLLFALGILATPMLSLTLPWWSGARLAGSMSPGFVVTAGGLYAFFLALGIAAASLARSVEVRMLGTSHEDDPQP